MDAYHIVTVKVGDHDPRLVQIAICQSGRLCIPHKDVTEKYTLVRIQLLLRILVYGVIG